MLAAASNDVEFWRITTVMEKVGLSKSEIYRRIALDRFPKAHSYPDSPRIKFWLSTEVRDWQRSVLDAQFAGLFQ